MKKNTNIQFWCAIGPFLDPSAKPGEIIYEFSKAAEDKNKTRINIDPESIQDSDDKTYSIFMVNSKQESSALTHFKSQNEYFAGLVGLYYQNNQWKRIDAIIDDNFEAMTSKKNVLNLSNLQSIGIRYLHNSVNSHFILFLAAVKCRLRNKKITKIIFKNNNVRNLNAFYNIHNYFHSVKTLIFSTDAEINDDLKNQLAQEKIQIIQDDNEDEFDTNDKRNGTGMGKNHIIKRAPLIFSSSYSFLTGDPKYSPAPHFDLTMYEPIQLNPDAFIANRFIIEFFQSAWNNISLLSKFYTDCSVFSITSNYHGPNSPLEYYDKYSRNLLVKGDNNLVLGIEQIISAQLQLFGEHFYACPTSFHAQVLVPQYIAAVSHGVFQINDSLFSFDRTMNIVFDHDHIAIINDHMFIRNPEPPQ